ncbi:MAG TPA: Crp/Fnr family transcriptional regulator [Flavisolibacter sp.]|nr:Crp/Fnr family transcriptional regulator [Flavisolibacter sp.]
MRTFYLRSFPLFCNLSEGQLVDVNSHMKFRQIYKGEVINYGSVESSKIFFLIKGKVKLTDIGDEENELVKDILIEGDVFGDLGMEGQPKNDEVAEALTTNTIICYCHVDSFRKIMELNPLLALNYARKVSSKLRKLEDRHADLVFRDTKSRLIRFIKNWAQMEGSQVGDKIVLNNYLTHSDIANFISTSRQSVNLLLNELRDSGFLYYDRKQIELNAHGVWN